MLSIFDLYKTTAVAAAAPAAKEKNAIFPHLRSLAECASLNMLVLVLLLHGYITPCTVHSQTHTHTLTHAHTYVCTFNFLKVLLLSQIEIHKFIFSSGFSSTKSLFHFHPIQYYMSYGFCAIYYFPFSLSLYFNEN